MIMDYMPTILDHPASTDNRQSSADQPPALTGSDGPIWAEFRALEEQLQQRTQRRDAWTMTIVVFAAVAVLFGIIGIGLGTRAVDESKRSTRAAVAAPTPVPMAAAPAPAGSPGAGTLSDFWVRAG